MIFFQFIRNFVIGIYRHLTSKLRYKLFFIYVIVITLTVSAFSVISYIAASRVIEKDFIDYKQKLNTRIITNIDRKIDILLDQSYSAFFILEDIQYVLREPAFQFSDMYFQSHARLNSYSLSVLQGNKKINGITLIDAAGQVKFHMDSQMLTNKTGFYNDLPWFDKTIKMNGGAYIREPHYREYVENNRNLLQQKTISVCRTLKMSGSSDPLGIIIFEVYCDNFWSDINDFEPDPSETLAVIGSGGEVIYINTQDKNPISLDITKSLKGSGSVKLDIPEGEILFNYTTSKSTGWQLVSIIPTATLYEKSSFIKKINNTLLIVVMIFILILSFFISNIITTSLNKLLKAFKILRGGDFTSFVHIKGNDEFAQIESGFNIMLADINTLITEKYQSNLIKKQAQLESLESQINPHFLYNTLALVKDEINNGDTKKSLFMIQNLSDMFRYSLSRGKHLVKLSDELEHIEKYLSIMIERFKDKFKVFYDIDMDMMNVNMPRLTLQPIVENCINHGFENIKSGGELHIIARASEWGYNIYVTDNGKGIEKEQLQNINHILMQNPEFQKDITERIGIFNVNIRIKFYFGNQYGLRITSEPSRVTTVKISLPLQNDKSGVL